MTVIVFGGTGSIGSEVVRQLLEQKPLKVVVFANNENELWETQQRFQKHDFIDYVLGDIREYDAVDNVLLGIDYAFNCAALKHVPICEKNPYEAVKTNIEGLYNIIQACKINCVQKLIQMSTDKAVEPICVMGATKFIGEKLCKRENDGVTKISCVRFGNVLGSRGSIVPIIEEKLKNGKVIPLTDIAMERYVITIEDAGRFIINCCVLAEGGETFVPKLVSVKIVNLIRSVAEANGFAYNDYEIDIIGRRSGEKLKEKLIADNEEYEDKGGWYEIK